MARDSLYASSAPTQGPQPSEPLLPLSPESLSQSEIPSSYPNTITTDASDLVHPATLHLKPVTWESLAKINFPPGQRFEVVDGFLVWLRMGNGTKKHQAIIKALTAFINQLQLWWAAAGLDVEVESTSGNSESVNLRAPDVVVFRRRPGSPSESSSGSEQTPKKHVLRTKDKPAYAQIEVTSESTRANDLFAKWQQYCQTGVKFYYIIDLYALEKFRTAKVIVGSKEEMEGWTRCINGDPDGASSSSTSNTATPRNSYYKKVYSGNDLVNVGLFRAQPLTASQLMSSTVLNRKAEEIKQRNESLSRQNESLSRQKESLSRQNASKDSRIESLSRQNASKDSRIETLLAEVDRLRGNSSNSQPDMERTEQRDKPSSSSYRQSTTSQMASSTNSPVKKRYKRKK